MKPGKLVPLALVVFAVGAWVARAEDAHTDSETERAELRKGQAQLQRIEIERAAVEQWRARQEGYEPAPPPLEATLPAGIERCAFDLSRVCRDGRELR